MKNELEMWQERFHDAGNLAPMSLRRLLEGYGISTIGMSQWRLQSLYADLGGRQPGGWGSWVFFGVLAVLASLVTWGLW